MIGPTGCGKSELVRTLSTISNAPFIKVEATQYTEIGYHGKDVEQIVVELTAKSLKKSNRDVPALSQAMAEDVAASHQMDHFVSLILLDAMLGPDFQNERIREDKLANMQKGLYDDLFINVDLPLISEDQKFGSIEDYLSSLPKNLPKQGLGSLNLNKAAERYTGKLADARSILQTVFVHQLSEKIDLKRRVISEIENEGIIFIDEIDKIVMSNVALAQQEKQTAGRNPSSEGVQRDLLPLIEGTTITTKYGDVNTTNILFICAGAFSSAKPTDMMPELLGRLPNRIQLQSLTKADFKQILTGVENNLIFQYQKLLETEGISVSFTEEAIDLVCSSSPR